MRARRADDGRCVHSPGIPRCVVLGAAGFRLFDSEAASAQEVKQIKLTKKYIQGFIAASKDKASLNDDANPDQPDPKIVAKRNGFASLAKYEDVAMNISMIMTGIDPQTKKFTEPPEQIRKQIGALKADKSVSEGEKKDDLEDLATAIKAARPIQFKENIALVLKYFDKLASLKDMKRHEGERVAQSGLSAARRNQRNRPEGLERQAIPSGDHRCREQRIRVGRLLVSEAWTDRAFAQMDLRERGNDRRCFGLDRVRVLSRLASCPPAYPAPPMRSPRHGQILLEEAVARPFNTLVSSLRDAV